MARMQPERPFSKPSPIESSTRPPHSPDMPIYQYKPDQESCADCVAGCDLLQRLADPALTRCPACGNPVHRVISAPQVVSGQSHRTSESHVGKHGFTQYKRAGKGVYEKTAGKGPDYISGD